MKVSKIIKYSLDQLLPKAGLRLRLDYIYSYVAGESVNSSNLSGSVVIIKDTKSVKLLAGLDKSSGANKIRKRFREFKERIAIGNMMYAVKAESTLAGYYWVSRDRETVPKEIITSQIPESFIYTYDAFIDPQFRRRGLFDNLVSIIKNDHVDGIRGLACFISVFNKRSQRAHEKLDFRKRYLILTFKLFNRFNFVKRLKCFQ